MTQLAVTIFLFSGFIDISSWYGKLLLVTLVIDIIATTLKSKCN